MRAVGAGHRGCLLRAVGAAAPALPSSSLRFADSSRARAVAFTVRVSQGSHRSLRRAESVPTGARPPFPTLAPPS
eukprot:4074341-Alexandrium_andersonii.AAC.1